MISDILTAMRADMIPAGGNGLWTVTKTPIRRSEVDLQRRLKCAGQLADVVPEGRYTILWRLTNDTIGRASQKHPGECVMNDFEVELRKHLQFVLKARGRVLVTGLGLGCVVRGLLAVGEARTIDIVERDQSVIDLCGASVADPRVTIHKMDARQILPEGTWDYAWHDLWSDPDKDEPALSLIHLDLIRRLKTENRARCQGAWATIKQRWFKRRFGIVA